MNQYWILYVVAIVALGYGYYRYANKQTIPEPQIKQLEPLKKDMTLQQLCQYNAENQRVLIALKGVIYDVSSSDFYSKGGAYSVFSGHDASINLAKMSHDAQYLGKYQTYKLDKDEQAVLNDWVARFQMKYPIVGKVI